MTVRQLVGEEEEHMWCELTGHTGETESEGEDSKSGNASL